MIVAETAGGPSFRGAALYYLHDRRLDGETERLTSERVAWTHVCNLPTDDPDRAWRMMAHTALAQGALKEAAGIKATGRKLTKPVAAYSLSWHPSEQLTPEEMLAAALASIEALGLDRHQAIIVAHRDGQPHCHVMLNRVHPETGVAANLGNSHRKLSEWALAYERGRGQIFCEERAANDERRRGLRPGEQVTPGRRISRPEYEATKGKVANADAARIRADHADRFGEQAARERHRIRQRSDEAAAFYRQRNEGRASIGERRTAFAELTADALAAHDRIALILAGPQPELALAQLTQSRSTFTRADLARLVARHTETAAQFREVLNRLESSAELVRLSQDRASRDRFTTRAQQAIEQRMERHALALHAAKPPGGDVMPRWTGRGLSADQETALRHLLASNRLAAVTGFAGSGKSTLLNAARQSWEQAGLRVIGMALSGVAADGLKSGAGIDSRTIQSRLSQWERGENLLSAGDVLVVDEAGMIGSRQMERILDHALAAGAKIVLAGDAEQLQAIEAGGAFKAITDRIGAARLTSVRRQRHSWQQDATRELATGRAGEALRRYEAAGMAHRHTHQADAMTALIDAWHEARAQRPRDTQLILAYTKADVRALNERARAKLRAGDGLGTDHLMLTEAGPRGFATQDRVCFLKNDRALGVRNGTLGTIERIEGDTVTVRLDGNQGRTIAFSIAHYGHLDHGYAATIHKSQGVTVDRAHLLASRNLDRHAAYVAMTRHRDHLDLHWSTEAIGSRDRLERIISREALKDTSLDYAPTAKIRKEEAPTLVARINAGASRFAKAALQARLAIVTAGTSARLAWRRAARDPRAELITFDAETAAHAAAMRQRHAADIEGQRRSRQQLQTEAARNWTQIREQAQRFEKNERAKAMSQGPQFG